MCYRRATHTCGHASFFAVTNPKCIDDGADGDSKDKKPCSNIIEEIPDRAVCPRCRNTGNGRASSAPGSGHPQYGAGRGRFIDDLSGAKPGGRKSY